MATLPVPGALLQATRRMRAWETDNEKGSQGAWVEKDDVGLVIQAWHVGMHKVRVRLIIRGRVSVFSTDSNNLAVNWQPVHDGVTSSLGP